MAQAVLDQTFSSVTTSAAILLYGRFNVQMSGDFVGTVAIERSRDNSLWVAAARSGDGSTMTYVFASSGQYNCSGLRCEEDEQGIYYRVKVSARTSGSLRVQIGVGTVVIPGAKA